MAVTEETYAEVSSQVSSVSLPGNGEPVRLRTRYTQRSYQLLKRGVDIAITLPVLVVLSPVFLVTSAIIVCSDGFPVIFRHRRIGKDGHSFYMFKFRTMVRNAEKVLAAHPELMEEYRKNYKIANDPRILRCGHFLRRTSIDELPQLFNVLRGEMSLVGPRPIVADELAMYGNQKGVYLEMKPGCAGLWQCSGRSETTYDERVEFDSTYFKTASVREDLRILARTFWAIVRRHGAV